jgi:hypothetical protein
MPSSKVALVSPGRRLWPIFHDIGFRRRLEPASAILPMRDDYPPTFLDPLFRLLRWAAIGLLVCAAIAVATFIWL